MEITKFNDPKAEAPNRRIIKILEPYAGLELEEGEYSIEISRDVGEEIIEGTINAENLNKAFDTVSTTVATIDTTVAAIGAAIDTKLSISNIVKDVFDKIYPVGSIYTTVNSRNPAEYLLGGEWIAWGAGRVPVGVNSTDADFNTIEKTGGNKNAVLVSHEHAIGDTTHSHTTIEQNISHNHTIDGGSHSHTANSSGTHMHGVYHYDQGNSGGIKSWSSLDTNNNSSNQEHIGFTSEDGFHTHIILPAGHTHGVSTHSANHNHIVTDNTHTHSISPKGESAASKNLQPYITCYMWKRTK